MLGGNEVIVIIVAAILLLFSGKKVTELMNSMGRAIGEFKKGRIQAEAEVKKALEDGKKSVGKSSGKKKSVRKSIKATAKKKRTVKIKTGL